MPTDIRDIIEQVRNALDVVMAVDIALLEQAVQDAHESSYRQVEDPPERFEINRQTLRMFWHFRCNLEAVRPHGGGG